MATHDSSKTNYVQTKGPSDDRSYKMFVNTPQPIKIVKKALTKFCTGEELNTIMTGYRRSEFSEEALLKDFWRADVPPHNVIKDTYYYKALALANEMLLPKYLWRPVHFADLRWYNFPLSVNAEAPFSTDKALKSKIVEAHTKGELSNTRVSFHNAYNYIFVKCRNWVHMIKKGLSKGNQFFFWITLHARSHLVKFEDEDKIRMVYGIPKLLLLIELMFLWPYFYFLRNNNTPIAWGLETLNGGFYKLSAMLSSLSYRPMTWLCLDWSLFDKNARFAVIDDVHESIRSRIDFTRGYLPTINYPVYTKPLSQFNTEMTRLFRWMRNAVKFTPVRLFDGSEYKRTHSNISSGLLSTQLLDTWVNFIMIVTCLLSLGIQVTSGTLMKLLGDDSIIALKEYIPESDYEDFLIKLRDEARRRFGAELNVKKSIIKPTLQGCHFLGYVNDNSLPKRDYLKLLAQLMYPERNWDLAKLAARSVGIAWASAGQSKLVYNVCKDVFEYITIKLKVSPSDTELLYLQYQGLTTDDVDTTIFPSFEELQRRLLQCTDTDQSEYLPSTVFLEKH